MRRFGSNSQRSAQQPNEDGQAVFRTSWTHGGPRQWLHDIGLAERLDIDIRETRTLMGVGPAVKTTTVLSRIVREAVDQRTT